MADMTCSIKHCGKEIVGTTVVLKDFWEAGLFEKPEQFDSYVLMEDGGTFTHTVILHPTCFVDLFHELMRQEGQTGIVVVVGPVGVIQQELGI
jgi:hypothetical protein